MLSRSWSFAHRRCKGAFDCLLVMLLLAGCGLGGASTEVSNSTGLVTATATVPTATTPPTLTPAATPSATAVATPTMLPMPAMPSPAPTSSPTVAGSPTAVSTATGTVKVQIIDFAFDPPLVEVPVGTTVVWRLVQGYHTVVSADFRLNSPPLNVGDTYSYTFTEEGTYDYICGIHPEMLGQVRVVR
jgi:plastocyanin